MGRHGTWVIWSYLRGTQCAPSYVYAVTEGKHGHLVHKETDDSIQAQRFATQADAEAVCHRLTSPLFSYQVHQVEEEFPSRS